MLAGTTMRPFNDITDPRIAKMLAHPLRVRILGRLEGRVLSPTMLADELSVDLATVSHHVRALRRLGLITLVKEVPRRGAVEHWYSVVEQATIANEAWAALPEIARYASASAHLGHIGDRVNAAVATGGFDMGDAHSSRSELVLDEAGWAALGEEFEALRDEIGQLEADSLARLAQTDGRPGRSANLILMLFPAPGAVSLATAKAGLATGQPFRDSYD